MLRIAAILCIVAFTKFVSAAPVLIDDVVDSHSNLFFTDWGHWFTSPADGALNGVSSIAARPVQTGGTSFDFSPFTSLSISASGSIVADPPDLTDPNGCLLPCTFHDGNFRFLPVYSLIGIWSSSATAIIPFGDWMDINSGLGLLFIGSSRNLFVPAASSAYLFLAENDGLFGDNEGFFNVHISAEATPEPSTLALMFVCVLLLVAVNRRPQNRTFLELSAARYPK